MDLIVDIVEGLVEKINSEIKGTIEGNIITTDNTKWAQKGTTINGVYITNFKRGKFIEVAEPIEPPFLLQKPKYFHGTILEGSLEIANWSDNFLDKVPLIYLREFLNETRQTAESNAIVRQRANVQLYLLTAAEHFDWIVEDAYREAVYPMLSLYNEFEKVCLKESCKLEPYTSVDLMGHTKFGVINREKMMFTDQLAGVEANFEMKVKEC